MRSAEGRWRLPQLERVFTLRARENGQQAYLNSRREVSESPCPPTDNYCYACGLLADEPGPRRRILLQEIHKQLGHLLSSRRGWVRPILTQIVW